jgi:hypothetical protein
MRKTNMVIEYKIKFEEDGIVIKQCIQAGVAVAQTRPNAPTAGHTLSGSQQESKAAQAAASTQADNGQGAPASKGNGQNPGVTGSGGGENPGDTGGGITGSTPITIIGPFVFCGHGHRTKTKDASATKQEEK